MDLLVDPETHDMVFVNGTCPVTLGQKSTVSQRLKVMLSTFLGEWFMDTDTGIPYFQKIFGKQLSKTAVDLIFQDAILRDSGVVEIRFFDSNINTATRVYSMRFTVLTSEGLTDEISLTI